MLNPADVLKLKYEYIKRTAKFLSKRTYLVDTCSDELLTYFSDAVQSELFVDCLEYVDECRLTEVASSYPDISTPVLPIPCADQIDVALSKTSVNCTLTPVVTNDIGGANPKIVLYDDEIYHDAVINIGYKKSCDKGNTLEEIKAGCSGDPEVCVDSSRVSGYTGVGFGALPILYPNGYVKNIRLYFSADGVTTFQDLDVSPTNVTTWTACGGCSPINPAHLYFNASVVNYTSAWQTLLSNIAETLSSETDPRFEVFGTGSNASWNYWTRIKHNPQGTPWMGINRNDSKFTIFTGSGDLQFNNTATIINQVSFISQSVDFETVCGSVTVSGSSNSGGSATPTSLMNFNFISYTTGYLPIVVTPTITGNTSCNNTTLKAMYNTDSKINLIQWTDPSDNIIASTSPLTYVPGDHTFTTTTGGTGEFTFIVILDNGCRKDTTITI